jgi:hypothetical protein
MVLKQSRPDRKDLGRVASPAEQARRGRESARAVPPQEESSAKKRIIRLAGALALVAGLSLSAACTPEQVQLYLGFVQAYKADVVSPGELAALRACESGGNYRAVSSSGTYRGAYQFDQGTWDSVASRHHSLLVGQDPAGAHPAQQDLMARSLWSERGSAPWPNC